MAGVSGKEGTKAMVSVLSGYRDPSGQALNMYIYNLAYKRI
jgi:uncharacterized protein YcbK (DUF882 family)